MAWTPSLAATHVEAVFHDESPGSVLVEHFNDPFEVAIADGTDASLRQAAHVYLGELQAHADIGPRLRFPPHWIAALAPARDEHPLFGWLPFDEPQPSTHQDITGPYGSFRFAPAWDDVAMLFAADRLGPDHYLGSG
ncbi:MAG: hypothetical protein JWP41_4462, partial [Ramlibacter sp.]|nr:hypothetical protein [Ramlibacter sp.]